MAEKTVRRNVAVTDEIATIAKDIDIFAGWLKRLENPDPVLRAEAAGRGLKLYDEVDRDAHAGSVLQQRIMAVVGKEWEIIPAKSFRRPGRQASKTNEEVVADFVSETLENCNFDQARQELLRAILYGYHCSEVMWQADGGGLSIRKMIGKHPRRFIFTPERELRLLTPQNMIDGDILPDRKFIVFTCGDSDNPYGRGLGQKLWWPVWFKKNGVKFWMVFLEKFGMPTVLGKYPSGTGPPEQRKLLDAIEAIQSDTGVKIPDSMDIEFLEASRAGTVTHEQLCDYMDRQISKAVLGQTLTTEVKGEGSYAASQTHNDVRQEIIEADADLLDTCLSATIVRWIVDYNFPGVAVYPKIKTFAAPKPDLVSQMNVDKIAVELGVKIPVRYFREIYGYPEPEEGEEIVSAVGGEQGKIFQYHLDYQICTKNEIRGRLGLPPISNGDAPPTPAWKSPSQPGGQPQFAEGAVRFTPDQQVIESLAASAVSAAAAALSANEQKILAAVEKAGSYEEAMQNVLELYPAMTMDDLTTILDSAVLNADLFGRWAAAEEMN